MSPFEAYTANVDLVVILEFFWLKNGEVAKDLYVAFTARRADVVRASYKAAIDAGATSNKEPSLRPEWHADYFAANIGDPDGYNIEIAYKPWLYK